MHIWVDADACPAVIKEILYRAAERLQLPMTLVANKPLRTPSSRYIRMVQVARGLDVADNEIARRLEPGAIILLHDGNIPAERLVETVKTLLDRLRALGYEVVRLDRMLA